MKEIPVMDFQFNSTTYTIPKDETWCRKPVDDVNIKNVKRWNGHVFVEPATISSHMFKSFYVLDTLVVSSLFHLF